MATLAVRTHEDRLTIGGLEITFQRTLRIPDDGNTYPLPPWLGGINAGDGFIRQFVAMPLGMGYTVEGQITGQEEEGGIQIKAFGSKLPPRHLDHIKAYSVDAMAAPAASMGLGAGGKMKQEIYPDEYGIDTWDADSSGRVFV